MKNTFTKNGVTFNADLLARLTIHWIKNDINHKNWGLVRWQDQLLTGKLHTRNPVQINSENFRKKLLCKQA